MNTATATEVRSLGTCLTCSTVLLHIGTVRERNGLYCECAQTGTPRLACWIDGTKGKRHTVVSFRKVTGKRTQTECGGECRSAKSNLCACSCAGENHGAALGQAW